MKLFTNSDVKPHGAIAGAGSLVIESHHGDLVHCPLDWQKLGLQKTASGYGAAIPSQWKISFCGKLYRIYSTCYSNAASCWFKSNGRTIYVN